MTAATGTRPLIPRSEAVRRLGAAMADRTDFVVSADPSTAPGLVDRLHGIPSWRVYLDCGTDHVITFADVDPRAVAALLFLAGPAVVLAVVPKTVPATTLSGALGAHVPDDGSQDVVFLDGGSGLHYFPELLIDAIATFDPAVAAQIRASDLATLS